MEAVILDGFPAARLDGVSDILTSEIGAAGWEARTLPLREMRIADCTGCFGCWTKTPGVCVIADDGREVVKAMVQSDLVVHLSPVTFGGYSSLLKRALDRSIGRIMPFFTTIQGEVHHTRRYRRYPSALSVGMLDGPDEESEGLFLALAERNARNMHPPRHAAGIVYASQTLEARREAIRQLLTQVEVVR